MKKYFLKIVFFLIFIAFIPEVKAKYGDLRYDVTNINVKGSNITFKGYAFIHQTNNYVTIEELDSYGNKTGKTLKNNGGQNICVAAVKTNNGYNEIIEEKCNYGLSKVDDKEYNFYCQMYFNSGTYGSAECQARVYNGTYNFFSDSTFGGTDSNTCNQNQMLNGSQCYYEDIGFNFTFDTSKWNISGDEEIHFQIRAKNNSYSKYTEYEDLFIREGIVNNNNSLSSEFIEYVDKTLSSKVKFIAETAWLTDFSGDSTRIGKMNAIYDIANVADAYVSGSSNGNSGFSFLQRTYSPGKYKIKTKLNSSNDSWYQNGWPEATPGDETIRTAWASWVKPTGSLSFRIKVKNDKKCPVKDPTTTDLICNNTNTYRSTCDELTIQSNNNRAVVKIEENGIISSILTPNNIYAGGGFKFGIVYYNTISWDYVSGTESSNIENIMKKKIKSLADFQTSIKLTEIKFGFSSIDDNLIEKKCYQNGNFSAGQTLTTVCTFYLPKSTMDPFTGDIHYGEGTSLGINNKFYTPLSYKGQYNIDAKIVGMNILTDTSTKDDSEEAGNPWTGIWNDTFENCSVNVYPLLEGPKETTNNGKNQFLFIYRPINLNTPFPNRFPGINWYNWYQLPNNQERLKKSYDNLQYSITIDDKANSKIKKYNDKQGTYFDWDTMEGEKSSFIDDYFNGNGDIKRQNIKEGDN